MSTPRLRAGFRAGRRSAAARATAALAAALLALAACAREGEPPAAAPAAFPVEETTIADIHRAMEAGELTARRLVELYLARIQAYDKQGPAINALITLNPRALERADELDAAFAATGRLTGPLHGIPVIVKDNYDTHDLPTTAGSLALASSFPPDDAFQVRRVREAGGIVLAKSNMAEWAFSPYETVGSALPGYTRNPYSLYRVTAGSSGGTAAAVAANFGTVGLGTDTGNSIRGPSSHNLLVGLRPTMGLTSRDGIVPLYLDHDVGGPMCRTVADVAVVLDVIARTDPADPVTEAAREHRAERYTDFLDPEALRGARIGVVRQLADAETGDPEVHQRFEEALAAMQQRGAVIVDPVEIPELDSIPRDERWCPRFRHDLEAYLASLGPDAPVKTLEEILESGKFHPSVARGLEYFQGIEGPPEANEQCRKAWANGELLAEGVRRVLEADQLDALVYPTWSNPPRLIGDLNTPAGDNSQDLSPHTGFPAITVPMGFVGEGLPVGLSILGDAWSEPELIALAYAYEQATHHRRAPAAVP
jgi:Asp-tRNA(Asn)/Glu-tRNA(Gln) amidotransferase A subunit family amidase